MYFRGQRAARNLGVAPSLDDKGVDHQTSSKEEPPTAQTQIPTRKRAQVPLDPIKPPPILLKDFSKDDGTATLKCRQSVTLQMRLLLSELHSFFVFRFLLNIILQELSTTRWG